MAEKQNVTKNTKTESESLKLKDTNIEAYSMDELIKMVNSTNGSKDFAEKYPEATFNRNQASYHLSKKYRLQPVSSIIIPGNCNKSDVFGILDEHLNGAKSDDIKPSKKSSSSDSPIPVICNLSGKTRKVSMTVSDSTIKSWAAFLKKLGVKKHMLHLYNSAALEFLTKMIETGKAELCFKTETKGK